MGVADPGTFTSAHSPCRVELPMAVLAASSAGGRLGLNGTGVGVGVGAGAGALTAPGAAGRSWAVASTGKQAAAVRVATVIFLSMSVSLSPAGRVTRDTRVRCLTPRT